MATITSVSLTCEDVQDILTAYLNTHVLRQHMTVTGVECLGDTFVVTLEPAPESAPIVTTTDPAVWTYPETNIYTTPTHPLVGHLNAGHNGHNTGAMARITLTQPNDVVGAGLGCQCTDTPAPTPPTPTADGRSSSVSCSAAASSQSARQEDPTAAPPAVGRKSGQKRISAVTPELQAEVLRLHAAGVPASRIAEDLTIGYATARRIITAAGQQRHAASQPQAAGTAGPGAA